MSENVFLVKEAIENGKTALGIELGSTRIKAVLIDDTHLPIATGEFHWENSFVDGVWTYCLDDALQGVQESYKQVVEQVKIKYGVTLTTVGSIGISGMMHGYLVFDNEGNQLVPFRTWRNTITEEAAALLTDEFNFNIPQRWNVAHLYQAILNEENHVNDIDFLTTLCGFVHWKLTGERVLGVGEASGVFPIDSSKIDYHNDMVSKFDSLVTPKNFKWKLRDILPKVLNAGDNAGYLTEEGALLLDPSGNLKAGIPLCPPEGDAGTGMVATNSIAKRTGNVSAGTSVFTMVVLEEPLSKVYVEIDMVTTPNGNPVAMVHCNNFTSDIDHWVKVFSEVTQLFDVDVDKSELYGALYRKALEGEPDCGGLISYNYFAGEPITDFDEGRPLFVRTPNSQLTLANFMRTQIFAAIGTLKIGMDILTDKEHVRVEQLLGHGGFFKTKEVGQRLMASALEVPMVVMETAGEGGPWGMAILAAYMNNKSADECLEDYLNKNVFKDNQGVKIEPNEVDSNGFKGFMERYTKGLAIQRAAVENLDIEH